MEEIATFFTQICYVLAITNHYFSYFTSLNLQNNPKGEILTPLFAKKDRDTGHTNRNYEQRAESGMKNQIHFIPSKLSLHFRAGQNY